jgi:hypothetical protein
MNPRPDRPHDRVNQRYRRLPRHHRVHRFITEFIASSPSSSLHHGTASGRMAPDLLRASAADPPKRRPASRRLLLLPRAVETGRPYPMQVIFGHDFGHELMPSDASHQQVPTQDANLIKTNLQVRRRAGHYGSRGCRFESCRARVYSRRSTAHDRYGRGAPGAAHPATGRQSAWPPPDAVTSSSASEQSSRSLRPTRRSPQAPSPAARLVGDEGAAGRTARAARR